MTEKNNKQPEIIVNGSFATVPTRIMMRYRRTIGSLMLGDWSFVERNSAIIDSQADVMTLDTVDNLPVAETTSDLMLERPAVMRVLRSVGSSALDGFVIDYRRIETATFADRGLSEGIDSSEFAEYKENFGTVLPLGVAFSGEDATVYSIQSKATDTQEAIYTELQYLTQQVDQYVAEHLPKPVTSRPVPKVDFR